MKILSIDTSSSACSIALLVNDQIKQIHQVVPMQQAQLILPLINELLESSHLTLKQIDAIAFGCGPGSFTGIRIAISVAQGLGAATKLPLIPVSSLAALAQSAHDASGWKNLLVAVDARIHEIYWGAYQADSAGLVNLIGKESLCLPEAVKDIPVSDWYGVGSGWALYQDSLVKNLGFAPLMIDSGQLPTAAGVARLAALKYQKQQWVSAEEAQPVYLRNEIVSKS